MSWFEGMLKNWMGPSMASMMFFYALFQRYLPYGIHHKVEKYVLQLFGFLDRDIQITFHEYGADHLKRSEAYMAIEAFLTAHCAKQAKRLLGELGKDSRSVALSMEEHEEVMDAYEGGKFVWRSSKNVNNTCEKQCYILRFHKKYRTLANGSYLKHIMEVGKRIGLKNKRKKLYSNNPCPLLHSNNPVWSHLVFDHPSTFETLAMDADKKKDIIDDLIAFREGKEYYARIGKAWQRRYLLYGPPGTGKSTIIAAMANFLDYDIYNIELTAMCTNNDLRKLLIETSNKSIIVIEDIDCSLDLTGQRRKKETMQVATDWKQFQIVHNDDKPKSGVTLSGLLNFIDGIWSASGGERIIIFTTNHGKKLDPALIRRVRMDKHIEMSYCSFGAFKVLAKNYLDIESHYLFESIEPLLIEVHITPADVAEHLMPKSRSGNLVEWCLFELIQTLECRKEKARLRAEKKAKKAQEFALDLL